MSEAKLPVGAKPENIGKVVTIQKFTRESNHSDTLLPETLEKHVGVLESYHHSKRGFSAKLVGGPSAIGIVYSLQYLEILLADIRGQ